MTIDIAYVPIILAFIVGAWVGAVIVALFALSQMKKPK